MSIRGCIVIPVYNHGDPVGRTVAALAHYGLPIYVVDDGSDAHTQRCLERLVREQPQIRVQRLDPNRGKGAAVMHGLRAAFADGYTHALQIDADGQHDPGDVPKFLAQAELNPAAVVCGQPIYDETIPKARLYGRFISHLWVWMETLSLQIKDSMCGYRLYPLALTVKVMDCKHIPERMDFDTAVVVRLFWAGAPVVNVPTRVTYPPGGVSHFDMLRDNARIVKMHAGLFLGMCWRLPLLLWRKLFSSAPSSSGGWAGVAERGSGVGGWVVFTVYRILGRTVVRALLYPVVLYFFVTGRTARRASAEYLERVFEYTRPNPALPHPPTWRDSLHHMLTFAESGLDRVAAWLGRLDYTQVDFPDRAQLHAVLASGRGAMLIGAHLGSWEILRALAASTGECTINAIVFTEHARRYNRMLQRANDRFALNLMQVSSLGPDTAINLQEKLDRGELLVISGDRTPPTDNGRVVRVPFLGHDALFAQGPFVLAAILGCPVYLFFCLRESGGYRIYLEKFSERLELPRHARAEALQRYVQRYAQRVESYCARAPFQWFNFFDFWRGASSADKNTAEKSSRHGLDHA